jgi:hypothetical protein
MKLDRNAHETYSFQEQKKEGTHYANFSLSELAEVFHTLQQTAYQITDYPAMDKTISSCR